MNDKLEARLSAIERRIRDLEIALELELPPLEGDPRTINYPPDASQRFKLEVDPTEGDAYGPLTDP
jgi:hypothetical protein